MKKLRIILFLIFILPCSFMFSACSNQSVYVTNIEQTETIGNTVTYTVTYSDGKKSILTVENGEDGQDLTLDSIKKYCDDNDLDFEDFLAKFLTVKYDTVSDTKASINKALQSAVSVYSVFPTSSMYTIGCGAGVIYQLNTESNVSYIITNYHVVYYNSSLTSNKIASDIRIFQYGTSEFVATESAGKTGYYSSYEFDDSAVQCEYVGGSMAYDIAVLKVKTSDLIKNNEHACAVTIAEDYSVQDTAVAIGNPEGEGIAVTSGIVSVESEYLEMTGADDTTNIDFRVMRIDTSVNGGNSGGGLFNENGELIGIVNAKIIDYEIENIAYALPFDNVTKVADNLIYYHEKNNAIATVQKVYLNITVTAENCHEVYNPSTGEINLYDDCIVYSVNTISPVYGELQVGDIIKTCIIERAVDSSVETYELQRSFELGDIFLTLREGDKLLLKGERNDETLTLATLTITSAQLANPDSKL